MTVITYCHLMVYHRRGMNHVSFSNSDTANEHHMGINAVPLTDAYVMPDNRIGLQEIILVNKRIRCYGREGTYHRTFADMHIAADARCLMNHRDELTAFSNNRLHASSARSAADRAGIDILCARLMVTDST